MSAFADIPERDYPAQLRAIVPERENPTQFGDDRPQMIPSGNECGDYGSILRKKCGD
jgi:hypothetical protein